MNQSTFPKSESTSWHKLNADQGLTKIQRVTWILYNIANNAFPRTGVDHRISDRNFCLAESELTRLWDDIVETASPARRLCDLFWMSLPWSNLSKELQNARVLEIGCGTGTYGRLLEKCLGESFEHYLGVDIKANEEWKSGSTSTRFTFEVGRAVDAYKFLPGANLILTQSALEHFEEDLSYFRQVSDYVAASQYPILQVHLIPSGSCILTYPWHGVRYYTPRTISKITRLFDEGTKIYLFSLGNSRCNRIHRNFITWPHYRYNVDLRYTKNYEYQQALRSAILYDFSGGQKRPAFYALVLVSNFMEDVFGTLGNALEVSQ